MLIVSGLTGKTQAQDIVTYYFVELIPDVSSPEYSPQQLTEIQKNHLNNIRSMAQEGKLLLAGPFEDGGGLFVLNADSFEEAQAWVELDPAVKAGRFTYKIRRWYTERGMLSLESRD
jgi:uncharacterized protein YciI